MANRMFEPHNILCHYQMETVFQDDSCKHQGSKLI